MFEINEMNQEVTMSSFQDRIIRAAKLDVNLYEEVEADPNAMSQAMLIVVFSGIAGGIGSGGGGFDGLIAMTIGSLVGWFVWAYIVYFVGTKLLPEPQTRADQGELLRTLGFASAPGLLRIIGIIPLLGWLVSLIASLWMLTAMIIAVRQALDYKNTGRAVAVCLIGWIPYMIIIWVIGSIFGGFAKPLG